MNDLQGIDLDQLSAVTGGKRQQQSPPPRTAQPLRQTSPTRAEVRRAVDSVNSVHQGF
jgi:hypothetical protein